MTPVPVLQVGYPSFSYPHSSFPIANSSIFPGSSYVGYSHSHSSHPGSHHPISSGNHSQPSVPYSSFILEQSGRSPQASRGSSLNEKASCISHSRNQASLVSSGSSCLPQDVPSLLESTPSLEGHFSPLCPPFLVSPIKVDKLEAELGGHPDHAMVEFVIRGLRHGF